MEAQSDIFFPYSGELTMHISLVQDTRSNYIFVCSIIFLGFACQGNDRSGCISVLESACQMAPY
jgi:hypothetical protein